MEMTPSPDSTAPEAKLLPCPFCGTLPISHLCQSCDEHGEPFYSYHEIACQNRECGMMPLVNVDLQEEDTTNCWSVAIDKALAAWNTRATRQESGEDSKQAVQIIEQLDALWASWLQSVSPKAREEIEAAVATIRKLILDSAMSRKEGAQL